MMKIKQIIFLLLIINLFVTSFLFAGKISFGLNGGIYYAPLKNYNDYITQYDYNKIGFGPSIVFNIKFQRRKKFGARIDFVFYKTSRSRNNEQVINDDGGYYYVTNEYTMYSSTLFLNFLYYKPLSVNSRFYLGFGPGYSVVNISSTYSAKLNQDDTNNLTSSSSTGKENSFALQFISGYERFFNRIFSLSAELNLKYFDLKVNTGTASKNAGLSGLGLTIGINYYL